MVTAVLMYPYITESMYFQSTYICIPFWSHNDQCQLLSVSTLLVKKVALAAVTFKFQSFFYSTSRTVLYFPLYNCAMLCISANFWGILVFLSSGIVTHTFDGLQKKSSL